MVAWGLRAHGLKLHTSIQDDFFNAPIKRFIDLHERPLDMFVIRFCKFRENEMKIEEFRVVGEWTLRQNQVKLSHKNDPNAKIPRIIPEEKYHKRIKATLPNRRQIQ